MKPVVVAEDTSGGASFRLLVGTPTQMPRAIDPQQPRPWLRGQWELVDSVWRGRNALVMIASQAWHATWVLWTPDWQFAGWYVNLQQPVVRTPEGFDHRDLQIDIVVRPDRTWHWKDEDDLARAVELGVVSADVAARARTEGERLIPLIEAGRYPFDEDITHRRPHPNWVLTPPA